MALKPTKSTGLLFHGIASAEVWDSTAEMALISGMDITDIDEGRCLLNHEHLGPDAGGFGQEIVGKVIFGKKLITVDDCENESQKRIWNKHKVPMLYVVGRLYDGAGHPGAVALASMIRDASANSDNPILGLSVEGSTIQRSGGILEKTIIKKIACTVSPASKVCYPELLYDPNAPTGFDKVPNEKEAQDVLKDVVEKMAKSSTLKDDLKHVQTLKTLVKAAVVQKMMEKKNPLEVLEKLSPQYLSNGMKPKDFKWTDPDLAFLNKAKSAPITINFSPAQLGKLARNGAHRNLFQHDNGTAESDERRKHEYETLGVPLTTWGKNRPVYGALHLDHAEPEPEKHALGGAPLYGSAFWALKPEVKDRSTFTHTDSYLAKPEDVMLHKDIDKVVANHLENRHQDPDPLIEAQIHGGVDLGKDVDSLHIHSSHPEVVKAAKKIGQTYNIPVHHYDEKFNKTMLHEPITAMNKADTAGGGNAAPGSLVGGAALAREVWPKKKKVADLLWKAFCSSGKEQTKDSYHDFLKASLPEVSDSYKDYYEDAIDNVDISNKTLKKSEPTVLIRNIEHLSVELNQALNKSVTPESVSVQNGLVQNGDETYFPGKATVKGKLHYLIQDAAEHYLAHPYDNKEDLIKLPKSDAGLTYKLLSPLQLTDPKHCLDACKHGSAYLNQSPQQHTLIQGLRLDRSSSPPVGYLKGFSDDTNWVKGPGNTEVFIKPDRPNSNEVAAYNIGTKFFGLSDHLPLIAAFSNPDDDRPFTAQEVVQDAIHRHIDPNLYNQVLASHAQDGTLDKLALFDHILGSSFDRHRGNAVVAPDGKLHLIDNTSSFGNASRVSDFVKDHDANTGFEYMSNPMQLEAQEWLKNLDRQKLLEHLKFNKIPPEGQMLTMRRFDTAREKAAEPRRKVLG